MTPTAAGSGTGPSTSAGRHHIESIGAVSGPGLPLGEGAAAHAGARMSVARIRWSTAADLDDRT